MRHGAILEAVAFAAERLLLTPDWRDAADEVLAGSAPPPTSPAPTSSRTISTMRTELLGSVRFEWCAPGVDSQKDNPFLNDAPWRRPAAVGRMARRRGAGRLGRRRPPGRGATRVRSPGHPLDRRASRLRRRRWWGAIGFDDCEEAGRWGPAEVEALRATATLLGAAITRQRGRRTAPAGRGPMAATSSSRSPPSPTPTNSDSDNVVRMGFVSPQIEQILGYPPERFLEDPASGSA